MKRIIYFCLLIALGMLLPSAQAGTKEELLRLQSDVLALQNQIRDLEKTLSEASEGLKSLVVQLNDQVAKSNLILSKLSATFDSQASGTRSADQSLLQEIRALSGKMDDSETRISALAQQLNDLKVQSKSLNQGGGQGGSLSPDTMYNQAFNDFIQGNFDLAVQEFTAYLNNFPGGDKAAAALYNIGEAYYNQNRLPQAIAAFTRVINDYSGSDKVASALFKRGKAELAMQESQNAIADFKDIIARFPTAPESDLAKEQLQNLGVNIAKPAKEQPRRKAR